jgi:hypothetical protein
VTREKWIKIDAKGNGRKKLGAAFLVEESAYPLYRQCTERKG